MWLTSLGDMTRHVQLNRQTTDLKAQLGRLTEELSTGQAADLTRHLGAGANRLAETDRRLALNEAFERATRETDAMLRVTQEAMSRIDNARNRLANAAMTLTPTTAPGQLRNLSADAERAFASTVGALNTRFGAASAFAGEAPDGPALADPAAMLADLRAGLAGALTNQDVIQAVDRWFDDPTGGFATMGYLGDTGALPTRRIDEDLTVTLPARADDPALRAVLKAQALAAVATDPALGFTTQAQSALLIGAGTRALTAAQGLADLAAAVGQIEERAVEATATQAARKSALTIIRNDITTVDPYQTAARLTQVQTQLETQYALTARMQRLSLVEYLR
jgi:flagellar hook-associated protein 3 FlgL